MDVLPPREITRSRKVTSLLCPVHSRQQICGTEPAEGPEREGWGACGLPALCQGLLPARFATFRCSRLLFSQTGVSQALSHGIPSLWDVSGVNDGKKLPWLSGLGKCWVRHLKAGFQSL